MVSGFKVGKIDDIPTHPFIQVKFNKSQSQEPNTHLRTLPSLKKLYDARIQEILKGIEEPAEKRLRKKEERTKLHKLIEEEFTKRKGKTQGIQGSKEHRWGMEALRQSRRGWLLEVP